MCHFATRSNQGCAKFYNSTLNLIGGTFCQGPIMHGYTPFSDFGLDHIYARSCVENSSRVWQRNSFFVLEKRLHGITIADSRIKTDK